MNASVDCSSYVNIYCLRINTFSIYDEMAKIFVDGVRDGLILKVYLAYGDWIYTQYILVEDIKQ